MLGHVGTGESWGWDERLDREVVAQWLRTQVGCSSKDRISCLWCSPEDAAPKGTAFTDSNQVLSVWSEVA